MRHRKRKSGFTLVELLVVVGIISLLIGLLLPAITKAKAASRATTCASNLRQIGVLYIAYAQQNNEYVPLGHAESVPPNQLPYPDIDREPGNPTGGTDGVANFTNRNHYIWAYGRPSSAGGLFLTSGMVGKRSARIFYCPADLHGKPFKYDVPENPWPEQDGQLLEGIRPTVTRITYATRPVIGQAWGHDTLHHTCSFPELSQLFRLKNQAIMAELPQVPPANHGSGASTFINVLYGDGAVRPCFVSKYAEPLARYLATPSDIPPGGWWNGDHIIYRSSCVAAISNDPQDVTIWGELDKN